MHEEFGGGARDEGFYFAADYEAVRAVFGAFDEFLEDEGAEGCRVHALDVRFCFPEGGERELCHVGAVRVV